METEKRRNIERNSKPKKKLITFIILIISIAALCTSAFIILNWFKDNKRTNEIVNEVSEIADVYEVKDNENTEIINPPDKSTKETVPNDYWDFIKLPLISVNFDELIAKNKDTVGWINVNNTNINYPVVQTSNNDDYISTAFDGTKNQAGWIFADYRNNMKDFDRNTIIYGHSRLNKTMFGSLKNILDSGWLSNQDNYVIKLSTQYENTLWQIFSVYHIPTTNDYIQTEFVDNNEFYTFATMLLNRSQHNFNTSINENDRLLTLSTCYRNDEKLANHAKLIKKESR